MKRVETAPSRRLDGPGDFLRFCTDRLVEHLAQIVPTDRLDAGRQSDRVVVDEPDHPGEGRGDGSDRPAHWSKLSMSDVETAGRSAHDPALAASDSA